MTKVNRRDFLKMAGAAVAVLAAPKAILELETPAQPLIVPDELELALANGSHIRLDNLGIEISKFDDWATARRKGNIIAGGKWSECADHYKIEPLHLFGNVFSVDKQGNWYEISST